ncbi:hypothetical protein [Undibacterium sp. Tian12W]|uniref:hypothetical protein n=1 Tax=Undibacterium sp. Tian12W TaxID=3413054 RepID=UPI003BF28DBA
MEDSKLLQGRDFHRMDLADSNFNEINLRASKFFSVDLEACRFANCSFKNITIESSDVTGMKINDIPVSELLRIFHENKK